MANQTKTTVQKTINDQAAPLVAEILQYIAQSIEVEENSHSRIKRRFMDAVNKHCAGYVNADYGRLVEIDALIGFWLQLKGQLEWTFNESQSKGKDAESVGAFIEWLAQIKQDRIGELLRSPAPSGTGATTSGVVKMIEHEVKSEMFKVLDRVAGFSRDRLNVDTTHHLGDHKSAD